MKFFSLSVSIPEFIKYEQQECAIHCGWNKTSQNPTSIIQELNLYVWFDFLYPLNLCSVIELCFLDWISVSFYVLSLGSLLIFISGLIYNTGL